MPTAFVPGFQYDVFISYRQADNAHGWVTRFDETLQSMLREHARPSKDEWDYRVFRDNRDIAGNDDLDEKIRAAASSSAVFVVIMSENYLAGDSTWCAQELRLFREALRDSAECSGRIFLVLRADINEKRRPDPLQRVTGYRFWEVDPTSGMQQPISFDLRLAGRVPAECQRLGNEIWSTLSRLKSKAPATPKPVAQSLDSNGRQPTVFLAEVTDELYRDRSGFFSFLEQEGIQVVPAKNQQFRFDLPAATTMLPRLLEEATMFVQLLGRTPIPSDEGFGSGLESWLFAQAQAAGKRPGHSLLRWRRQGMHAGDIADRTHQGFVFGNDVIADDLEQFKQSVVTRVRELTQRSAIRLSGNGVKVLMRSKPDSTHQSVADELADMIDTDGPQLARMPVESALIPDQVALETAMKEIELQQGVPKALLVVHADGDEPWVQARMKECRQYQLRKRPLPPPCAVVVKPPDDEPHPKTLPGRFEVIPHDDIAKLRSFLSKIASEPTR
jgi:hypothetical protein